jgi:hypothetical protein
MTSVLLCDGNANGEYVETDAHAGDTIVVSGSHYTIAHWALGLTEELVGFCDDVDYPDADVLMSRS